MKKTLTTVMVVFVFIAGVLIGDMMNIDLFKKEEPKYDLKIMEEQIEGIWEMAALEYRYKTDAKYDGGARQAFGIDIPLTSKSMLVYYEGIVKLGSDLADLKIDLNKAANKAVVYVPHSEILSHEIDEDTWEVLDVDNGLFNKVTPQDNSEFVKKQKKNMEKEIGESDLFKQADEKTADRLTTFLKMEYPELKVEVKFIEEDEK